MFPPRVPTFELYAGDDFSQTLRFTENGSPKNLSAWTDWKAQWRAGDVIQNFDVDDSQAGDGLIALSLDGAQTREMEPAGVWDVQANLDGIVKTWAAGSTIWRIDVTGRP